MHHYEERWEQDDAAVEAHLESFRFADAVDVAEWASFNIYIGHQPLVEAWHLDREGVLQCATKGGSFTTIRGWAEDPRPLRRSRRQGVRETGCADRWVIVDSRPSWMHPPPTVTEADAEAFVVLRSKLRCIGVSLLDGVIFDDHQHWWSLHELTSGSTRWPAAA